MITELKSHRFVVISDLHLGNPFSKAKSNTVEFLSWASRQGFDIIINGDGFEIAQVSFSKIARDVPQVFHALKSATAGGRDVYYVIGNHDIVLENFLNDWGGLKMAPFLNVWSGERRIRIEHGHLYDKFFIGHPELYETMTSVAGIFLHLHPGLYRAWIGFEKLKSKYLWEKVEGGIAGEHANFMRAAHELARRGFDDVIFGHTHHAGQVDLGGGKTYTNSGSWLIGTPYVEVTRGIVKLKRFDARQAKTDPSMCCD
jgi:UDP-2,3-diacylglucosamine pyrophosphatase LpxH